jgi:hypothetical protein
MTVRGFKKSIVMRDPSHVRKRDSMPIIAESCPACTKMHLINRKSGRLLGQDED